MYRTLLALAGIAITPGCHAVADDQPALSPDAGSSADAGVSVDAPPTCPFVAHPLTFAPPVAYPTAGTTLELVPFWLASCDVDGDGKLDLVVGHADPDLDDGTGVSVLTGRGDGTFSVSAVSSIGPFSDDAFAATTADLNGDGRCDAVFLQNRPDLVSPPTADLVVALSTNGHLVAGQRLGFPNGLIRLVNNGFRVDGLVAEDLDGDGLVDLAVGIEATPSAVAVYRAVHANDFLAPVTFPVSGVVRAVATGDLDHDGTTDLVVSTATGIDVLRGNPGNGTYKDAVHSDDGAAARRIAVADLDGDGFADVVAATSTKLVMMRGRADGTLAPAVQLTIGNVASVAIGDLDGDCLPDIVAVLPGAATGSVAIFLGKNAYAMPSLQSVVNTVNSVVIADMNGDGRLDIVVSGGDFRVDDEGTSIPSGEVDVLLATSR